MIRSVHMSETQLSMEQSGYEGIMKVSFSLEGVILQLTNQSFYSRSNQTN